MAVNRSPLPAVAGDVGQRLHIGQRVIGAPPAHAAQQVKFRLPPGKALLDGADHVGVVLFHRQPENVVELRHCVQRVEIRHQQRRRKGQLPADPAAMTVSVSLTGTGSP